VLDVKGAGFTKLLKMCLLSDATIRVSFAMLSHLTQFLFIKIYIIVPLAKKNLVKKSFISYAILALNAKC